MKIRDIVFNQYQGIRRFGVVVDKYTKGSWSYVKVQWVDDDIYERAMKWQEQMGRGDCRLYEYRVDQVRVINAEKELAQLRMCLELSKL